MIRVVLAEDQLLVLGALAALLALEDDIEVVGQARDGAAALDLVHTLAPDILLTDVEMPGLSGLDVCEAIAAEKRATRVVIVTTFARPGYLRRAMEARAAGYLLKDAPPDVLAAAVRTVAAGGRAIAPELAEAAWDAAPDPLTDRERMVLRLADEGRSNKEIAQRLGLSPGTVRNYLADASAKLGASGRIEAARIARRNGWM
ncbi:MAG: response regulator transcription factor [Alphaproteobacteria bacterium]|nr:response regulator transcription factor [Alphaproteobacteria bacterium]